MEERDGHTAFFNHDQRTEGKSVESMLDDDTYRKWTDVFMPGSPYVGDWNKGSKILFLAPGETGKMDGMVSRIKENRKYEYISIEHIGVLKDGVEDTESEEAKKWAPAYENYTFRDVGSGTEVSVDMDSSEEYKEMFLDTWPKAFQKLKELVEK